MDIHRRERTISDRLYSWGRAVEEEDRENDSGRESGFRSLPGNGGQKRGK